jgi:RND superfamily putative drug exporter
MRPSTGKLKTLGRILPQQAGAVRRRTRLVDLTDTDDPISAVISARDSSAPVVMVDNADRLTSPQQRAALAELINSCATGGRGLVLAVADPASLRGVLPDHHLQLELASANDRLILTGADV